jgi:hypothetical protein
MDGGGLHRTVRRGFAAVTVPFCATTIGFERFVWSDSYGVTPPSAFGVVAFELLPALLLVVAAAYLALSVLADAARYVEPAED